EDLVRLPQLAGVVALELRRRLVEMQPAVVRGPDFLSVRVGRDAEERVEITHPFPLPAPAKPAPPLFVRSVEPARMLLARLCSRRQPSIRPWSPESSTSGTPQPRNSDGRVYCGVSRAPPTLSL